MTRPKNPRPAWRTCARPGCPNGFKPKSINHHHCSETCQHAARYTKRYEFVEDPCKGGIASDGAIVSGTEWRRPVIEVSETPQNDPRFW